MDRNSLKRLIRRNFSSIVVVAIILAIFIVGFGSSILEIIRLSELKQRIRNEIAAGEEEINQLNEDKKQIGKQPYVERIARTYLGLYYPNELIVVPVESKPVKSDSSQAITQTDNAETTVPAQTTETTQTTEQVQETVEENTEVPVTEDSAP